MLPNRSAEPRRTGLPAPEEMDPDTAAFLAGLYDDRRHVEERQEVLRAFAAYMNKAYVETSRRSQAEWASFIQEKILWLFRILQIAGNSGGSSNSSRSAWSTSFSSQTSKANTNNLLPSPPDTTRGRAKTPNAAKPAPPTVTWAQIAGSGKTSQNTTNSTRTSVTLATTTPEDPGWRKVGRKRADQKDERLFVRISDGHAWREASAEGFRINLCRELKAPLTLVKAAKKVDTGFSQSCREMPRPGKGS